MLGASTTLTGEDRAFGTDRAHALLPRRSLGSRIRRSRHMSAVVAFATEIASTDWATALIRA